MMPEVGEVRDFATGFVEPTGMNDPGVFAARMATEQRIWTGSEWAVFGSKGASEALAVMMKRNQLCAGSAA